MSASLQAHDLASRATIDLTGALPAEKRGPLGIEVVELPGGVAVIASAFDHVLLNRFLASGDADWARVVELFEARGVPRFWIQVEREAAARQHEALLAAGLAPYPRDWHRLVRGLGPPLPEPLRHLRDATPDDAAAIGLLLEQGFSLPDGSGALYGAVIGRSGWKVLVAEVVGEVASVGIAYQDGDGVYLAAAATTPEFRGRGFQKDLMAARLRWARDLGCTWACTETGEPVPDQPSPSWHNMHKLGFEVVGGCRQYCPPGTTW